MSARGLFDSDDEGDQDPAPDESDEQRMARILAQIGLQADRQVQEVAPSEPWYLWPCNLRTWDVWCGVQTQWRTGLSGVTGLDYAGVWVVVERHIPKRRRAEVFAHLQDMERAILKVQAERHEH